MSREKETRFSPSKALATLVAVLASAVVLSASGCGRDTGSEASGGAGTRAGADTKSKTSGGSSTAAKPGKAASADDYDPSLFDETSTTIDNEWWPLEPGTRFVWRGWTQEERERVPHRIVFTVTDLTKVIDGVRTVVGWDRDFSGGELVETELIFLAQDRARNVWHFGQYAETWEGPEMVGGQAWLVGYLKGAKAGIMMQAEPRLGARAYSQGFAPPPLYWDDHGRVFKTGQRTCVPAGCFENVLVIEEFEPTKPGAFQLKYYAPGVGNIRTGWRGEDADREVLVLEKVVRLGPKGLARARAAALALESRASVYGEAPRAERR